MKLRIRIFEINIFGIGALLFGMTGLMTTALYITPKDPVNLLLFAAISDIVAISMLILWYRYPTKMNAIRTEEYGERTNKPRT